MFLTSTYARIQIVSQTVICLTLVLKSTYQLCCPACFKSEHGTPPSWEYVEVVDWSPPPVSSTGGPTKKCLIKIPTSFKSQPEVLEKLGKRKGGTGEQSSCP